MKKLYILPALLAVLISCSEWKYSKGVKWEKPEYHSASNGTERSTEDRSTVSDRSDKVESKALSEEGAEPVTMTEAPARTSARRPGAPGDLEEATILVKEDDTLAEIPEDAVDIALRAESQGRKSRTLGIVGLVLSFTYIFAIVGLILAIIGLIKGVNSLRAPYNTPKGVSMARTGVVTSSITIGLYLLAVLLIVLLVILLI